MGVFVLHRRTRVFTEQSRVILAFDENNQLTTISGDYALAVPTTIPTITPTQQQTARTISGRPAAAHAHAVLFSHR